MSYSETKVYFDGSHYIAIPHTTRPTKKRPKPIEEDIIVEENLYYSDSTLQNGSFIPCKGFPQINYWFYPHLTYLRSDNNLIFRLDKCDGTLTIKGVIKYVKLENIQ